MTAMNFALWAAAMQSVGGGGAPPAWTPLDLGATLKAWWDAEYNPTLITHVAGAVSSWKDIVAAYDVVQATGANQPAYSATSFNGTGGVTFNGTSSELTLAPVPAGIPVGANPCEMWVLVDQVAAPAAVERAALAYGAANSQARKLTRSISSNPTNRADITTSSVTGVNGTVDFSGRHVVRAIVTATTSNANVDGVAGTDAAVVPNTVGSRLRIGANSASTAVSFWQGVIAAALITAPLSAGEATQMYTYLNARL